MPTLNQAAFIARAIDSVLGQDYEPIELIVVDGQSTDGTLDILASYGDRLRYSSQKDRNLAEAINKGIRSTTGDIIHTLASDETLEQNAVSVMVDHFEGSSADVVAGQGFIIDEDDNVISPIDNGERITFEDVITLRKKMPLACTMFRRSVFERELFDEDFDVCTDFMFWISQFEKMNIVFVEDRIARWRRQENSWSVNPVLLKRTYDARLLAFDRYFPHHPEHRPLRAEGMAGACYDLAHGQVMAGWLLRGMLTMAKCFLARPKSTWCYHGGAIRQLAKYTLLRLVRSKRVSPQ